MEMELIKLQNVDNCNEIERICVLCIDNVVYVKIQLGDRIGERPQDIELFDTRNMDNRQMICNNGFIPHVDLLYSVVESLDIILRVKRNYHGIPKYLQFSKLATISQMILEMTALYNILGKLSLLKADGSIIDNNLTLEASGLVDYSKVKIWVGESFCVRISLRDPLKTDIDNSTQVIGQFDYSVTEKVENLKAYIQSMNYRQFHNLQLFTDTAVLDNNKQLLNYPLEKECTIYCVDMQKRLDVTITDDIGKGKYAEISLGRIESINRDCAVYKYAHNMIDLNDFKVLKYEIVTRLKLANAKNYPFVELIAMYIEFEKLYIVTENMARGSLRSHLTAPLEVPVIIQYCRQILKGLEYMHSEKIIHRNINCESVLIDGKGNAKLCNFYLSKFLYNCTTDMILSGIKGSKVDDDTCCVAPEVLLGEPYGFKADVWSFGATLIEIVTLRRPYPDINNVQAFTNIAEHRTIIYEQNRYPNTNFDEIISSCIQPLQKDRPIVSDLLDKF